MCMKSSVYAAGFLSESVQTAAAVFCLHNCGMDHCCNHDMGRELRQGTGSVLVMTVQWPHYCCGHTSEEVRAGSKAVCPRLPPTPQFRMILIFPWWLFTTLLRRNEKPQGQLRNAGQMCLSDHIPLIRGGIACLLQHLVRMITAYKYLMKSGCPDPGPVLYLLGSTGSKLSFEIFGEVEVRHECQLYPELIIYSTVQ